MNKKETKGCKETLVQYSVYKEKREELQSFLNREVIIWGGYSRIPDYIKKIIDQELLALGRYAKRINAPAIEKNIETGSLQSPETAIV